MRCLSLKSSSILHSTSVPSENTGHSYMYTCSFAQRPKWPLGIYSRYSLSSTFQPSLFGHMLTHYGSSVVCPISSSSLINHFLGHDIMDGAPFVCDVGKKNLNTIGYS